jgi:hypothetical protein
MRKRLTFLIVLLSCKLFAQFEPAVGYPGSSAIHKDSSDIVNWASAVVSFNRGLEDITEPLGLYASFGEPENALFKAEGNSTDIVSLGDSGTITLAFPFPIMNGAGNDFAVFENSFSDTYLEFAHVEVSTDGERFVRIPSTSLLSTTVQIGTYETCLTEKVHNLAGKYRQGYGTPFDLEDVRDSLGINVDSIQYVRIVDVVGSINPAYGTFDHTGNIINDPFKTDFESGGFDLDAVAVMNENNIFASLSERKEDVLTVYPNPTTSQFRIQLNGMKDYRVEILDVFGKTVAKVSNASSINLCDYGLVRGMYIVKVYSNGNQIGSQKIIFQP